jgi:hypothetical protein
MGLIIAIFGILTAALFAKILIRHTQWAQWYVSRSRELADNPQIFPQLGEIPELKWIKLRKWSEWKEKWKELGPVIRPILIFLLCVAIAWAAVLVWLFRLDTEALPPNPSLNTWNNCPPNYTVQGGMCKPYRGP